MSFVKIIKIIENNKLCNNWEVDENVLILYYRDFDLYLLYDNGYLVSIFKTCIENDEYRNRLKKYFKNSPYEYTVYSYDQHLYIQTKYKRFKADVIFDNVDIDEEIDDLLKLLKNPKKSIPYPHLFINQETKQKSNYQILDNELL